MKISVILLTYNRVKDTLELLGSLENQNYEDFEIILVDNNSSDETVQKVKENFPIVNCIEIKYNAGVPGGRNVGIKNARGDYLVFIDNDAEVGSNFLEDIESTFKSESRAGVLAFRIVNYYTREIDKTNWVWNTSLLNNEEFKLVHKFLGGGCAIRKEVINQVGMLWDDLFFMHEEKDFCMRLLRTNYRVFYTPKIEVYHKVSPEKRYESKERSFFYGIRNEFWVYIRNVPFYDALKHLIYLVITALLYSIKRKSFGYYMKGVVEGIFLSKKAWKIRSPLSQSQFKLYLELSNKKRDKLRDRFKRFLSC
jgi:GT2 family glycosyltransferase